MFPIFSSHDEMNQTFTDAISMRKRFMCVCSCGVLGAHLTDLFFGQFGHAMCAALIVLFAGLYGHSAFAVTVDSVIASRSQKQVIRANTGAIVASMQNADSLRKCTEVQLEREAMHHELPAASNAHSAISGVVSIACPVPACFSFVDMAPKTFYRVHDSRSVFRLSLWKFCELKG